MSFLRFALPAVLTCLLLFGVSAGCGGKGSLHVLVVDENNIPLSGAKVISSTQPEGQLKVTGDTDAEGAVVYDGIVAGEYQFYVSRFDYENREFQVTVKAGRSTDVTITLKKIPGPGEARLPGQRQGISNGKDNRLTTLPETCVQIP